MAQPKLTIREIQIGRKKLDGVNPLLAMSGGTAEVFEAMAVVAWLIERRANPTAPFDRYLDMTVEEVDAELDRLAPDAAESADESPQENPTDPAPEP